MNAAPNAVPETPFLPFATIWGTIAWSCMHCGHVQKSKLSRGQYILKCKQCERRIEHGSAFRLPVPGRNRNVKPRDIQIDLAPLRRALVRPRRLSDRGCIIDLDFADYSLDDEVVNTDHVDATDPD